MQPTRQLRTTLALLAALAPATAALASPTLYTLTDLGTLSGGAFSNANSINNTAQITGQGDSLAYLYSNGSMTALPGGTPNSAGNAINSAGTVVGWLTVITAQHPVVFSGGTAHDLGTFGGTNGQALGINSAGQVVGNAAISGPIPWTHAFLYNGTSLSDLGTLGGNNSSAHAINTAGQIVGYASTANEAATHAFLYSAGHMTDLGTLPAGGPSRAIDINDAGLIVGAAGVLDHPFLYAAGHMTDLGTLGGPTGVANAINSTGTIVGTSFTNPTIQHAFVYTGSAMYDLNSLLAPGTPAGYILTSAADINDSGQIVGSATTPNGQIHGYLLTPVPEPATLVTCAFTALPLVRRRRR